MNQFRREDEFGLLRFEAEVDDRRELSGVMADIGREEPKFICSSSTFFTSDFWMQLRLFVSRIW